MNCDFKKLQKTEAIKRTHLLDLPDEIIESFEKTDQVFKSDSCGNFYTLTAEELAFVKQFEQKRDAIVYYVLESYTYNFRMLNYYLSNIYNSYALLPLLIDVNSNHF